MVKKNIVIFDLDGTIAIVDERRKISTNKKGKINWSIFFNPNNIDLDKPNEPVIKILKILKKEGYKIIIVSGRLDTTKKATISWLSKHNIVYEKLIMRKDNNTEKFMLDENLKEKWLKTFEKKKILCVFDDRTKVVEMWRKNNLACFQVGEGNF